ncbi:hypothetical protein MAFF212519_12630 [Clavibacter michiganensis]
MLTSTATLAAGTAPVEDAVEEQPAVERPAYRPFAARVARTERISPTFLRITFQSDDLRGFGDECLDQRIKLLLPVAEHGLPDLTGVGGDDWFAWWRALPDAERNPLRTYTSRAVRRDLGEVDVDFALHGDMGPASRWAGSARVGDEMVLIGPDALSPARASASSGIPEPRARCSSRATRRPRPPSATSSPPSPTTPWVAPSSRCPSRGTASTCACRRA